MRLEPPEIAAELTPWGAYLRLRGGRGSFLLESVEQGRLGRYSLVGCGSRLVDFATAKREALPVVGYLGYDHVAVLEPTVPLPAQGPSLPTSLLVVPDLLLRFDHVVGTATLLYGEPEEAERLLARPPRREPAPASALEAGPLERHPERAEHLRRVRAAKEHILAGDVFQVVLSQRAERRTSASALDLYRALRRVNPSPYLFLLELDCGDGPLAVVGSSPETVVKCAAGRAALNPIAGTVASSDDPAEDRRRLLASEKDRAEHMMLVDLGRNDLSRVCRPGTVEVARLLEVERYSHVTHLVSEVVGELADGDLFALLEACFPAGTVSGAPKVRAMQLISELEGYRRGVYGGAVGYLLPELSLLDTSIAIRTAVLKDGVAYLQAGGGIVWDSDPEAEDQECRDKMAAVLAAIELAERRD